MNERAAQMMNRLKSAKWPICTVKLESFWRIWPKYANENPLVWRSKYHAEYLRSIPVFLDEGDLICGSGAGKLYGAEIDPEWGFWSRDELELLIKENGRYYLAPEDLEKTVKIMDQMAADTRVQNIISYVASVVSRDPRMLEFMKSGVVLPPWKDAERKTGGGIAGAANAGLGIGPLVPNAAPLYENVVRKGFRAMIREAQECLENHRYIGPNCVEKKLFWEGLIEILEAAISYARRHADHCEALAKSTDDLKRKQELLEMARICRKVPEYPADTFREALQSFWFGYLLYMPPAPSGSRPDQLLYPFYQQDLDAGQITEEEALELLEVIRAKCMQLHFTGGSESRKRNSGNASWMNFVMGGLTPEGEDATNPLTMLFFRAAEEMQVPHHTLTYRINEKTPAEAIIAALRVVKKGMGLPAFVSDRNYMRFYMDRGFSFEEASNYGIWGCLDGCVIGKSISYTAKFVNIPMILEIFLHNGICPRTNARTGILTGDVRKMKTWEEFFEGFKDQMYDQISHVVEASNLELDYMQKYAPNVYCSSMMDRGIQTGLDNMKRTFDKFNAPNQFSICGGIDAADALYAIRKLVFEEKRFTMEELLDALDNNWNGYESIRKACLETEKYGNDFDDADLLVNEVYEWFVHCVTSHEAVIGGTALPAGVSISAHGPSGSYTGATANGRCAGDCLSDGSISPERGMDRKGLTALLRSAMKIHQSLFNATLLNVKLHPSLMKTAGDLEKLAALIKTYLCGNGKHIQINVVDQETLTDAQIHPETHEDLLVRVAGYSAYFVDLNSQIQNEVIARTGFERL